jgi:hypothetical protein
MEFAGFVSGIALTGMSTQARADVAITEVTRIDGLNIPRCRRLKK